MSSSFNRDSCHVITRVLTIFAVSLDIVNGTELDNVSGIVVQRDRFRRINNRQL